jgi:hypothetical protein
MFNSKRISGLALIVGGGIVLFASGCNSASQASYDHADKFAPEGQVRDTQRLSETQMAAGARADDTLYPQHFDGAGLSSLGTAKLDLVLEDSHSCNPLTVYLAIPNDENLAVRRRAVGDYLIKHGGLKPEQLAFEIGSDPSTYLPATVNVANYSKTDTASDSGGGSSSSASAGSYSGSSGH